MTRGFPERAPREGTCAEACPQRHTALRECACPQRHTALREGACPQRHTALRECACRATLTHLRDHKNRVIK